MFLTFKGFFKFREGGGVVGCLDISAGFQKTGYDQVLL